jgi:hypothetical protein
VISNPAQKLLANFAEFWDAEISPAERHRLLVSLFERVWQDNGQVVAVKPRPAFTAYFQAVAQTNESRSGDCGVMSGSDGGRTLDCCLGDRDPAVAEEVSA